MGLSGNILVKLHIPKPKFDNVFDIREDYSLNIQNMRKFYLLGFSIQQLWGKSLKNQECFPLISKYGWMGGSYSGLHPFFILGPNTYWDIDFQYFKLLTMPDFLQNSLEIVPRDIWTQIGRGNVGLSHDSLCTHEAVSGSPVLTGNSVRCPVTAYDHRTAPLRLFWASLKLKKKRPADRCVHLGQLYNQCLPSQRGGRAGELYNNCLLWQARQGRGGGGGGGGGRGGGPHGGG